jgi:excisionase family DNA binding protein
MDETILTPDQVAQILQIHPFTVLKFIKQGKLKASKLGRVYRIRKSDVDAFLDEQAKDSQAAMEKRQAGLKEEKAKRSKIKEVNLQTDIVEENEVTANFETAPLHEEKSTTVQTQTLPRKNSDHYIIEFKTDT